MDFMNSLYNFFMLEWGWVLFLGINCLILIVVFLDSNQHSEPATGWLISLFASVLVFLPVAIYAVGSPDLRASFADFRLIIFYLGGLATTAGVLIGVVYLWASRTRPQVQPIEVPIEPMTIQEEPEPPPVSPPPVPKKPDPTRVRPQKRECPKVNAWLIDVRDEARRHQLCQGQTSVGRRADNDIVFTDLTVSNAHMKIVQEGNQFILHDMGSSAGTLVNGYPVVDGHALRNGDVLLLGDVQLRFVF